MTREEAIEIFKDWIDEGVEYDGGYAARDLYEEEEQAVNMAIKALSQEPCDDAISRQAVLSMQYRIDDSATLSTRDVVNVDDIEDLPPVRPQLCDDAISRDAVDKYIARLLSGYLYDGERERLEVFSAYLWELPSVTQKSGKWICYNYPAHECVYCSNCKTEYYEDDLYLGGSEFPKYCPNCGAKMESEVSNG